MTYFRTSACTLSGLSGRLMLGSALASLALLAGGKAFAQNEQVVVTGTSIRGTAPIGSNIISVDRTSIEESGAVTISELMTNIPQITGASGGFGSSGQRSEGGGGGFTSPNIHSLGTQASTATLVLIDGHIIAPVGNATLVVDPSVIPTAALQRVEVLPDGASAIYGANAVAGVINYITRRDYSGWETRVGASVADHYNTFSASQLFGHTWETGSVMAVYAYSNRSALFSKWRAFETSRQDIRMGAMTAEQALLFGTPITNASGAINPPPAGIPTTLVSDPVAVAGSDPYRGRAIPFPSIGSNFQNFNCPVAAISTGTTTNAFLYPYGAGGINNVTVTNGSGGTMTESGFRRQVTNGGTMGVCDQDDYGADLFSDQQQNVLVAIRQQITDRISLNMDLVRGSHLTTTRNSRGNLSAIAFNPNGTGGPAFGSNQRNPFYVGVPGAASNANSEFITYNFDELLGPGAFNKTEVTNQFATLGLDVDLGSNWALTIGSTLGSSSSSNRSNGGVASAQATLALNGTTNTSGTGGNALVDPYNLNTVTTITRALTTANALDVWNPAATNRTSQAVLRSLVDSSSRTVAYSNVQDVTVKLDGPLGDFWGAGDLKTAVGANYNHYTQPQYLSNNNGVGPSSTSSRGRTFAFNRTSYAAFAEFLIPLINQDMGIPLVQKLVINVSGRYDHFSDFGETKNPKASLAWDIIDGLAARGSYSTSFVAPNPHDVGGPEGINSQTAIQSSQITNSRVIPFRSVQALPYSTDPFTARGVGTAGTFVETPAACLALNSVSGLSSGTAALADINGTVVANSAPLGTGVGQAYGCRLTTQGNAGFGGLQIGGAKGDLKPQRGLTYSAGLDIDAGQLWDVLTGFTASITYYNTKFMDVITNQQVQANIPEATSFGPAVSASNPLGGWSPTDPNIVTLISSRPLTSVLPSRIYTIVDNRIQNPFTIWQAGFDFELNYRYETDEWGTFTWSMNGNEVIRFSQRPNSVTGVVLDVNNCTNNARYCTSELQGSMRVGWRYESFNAGVTFNYVHPYTSPNTTFPYNQPGQTVNGAITRPANFAHVGSLQTFDLNFGYTLPDEWLSGASVTLNINNVLDKPPPFFDNSSGFTNGSQIGRTIAVSMTKKW
jgi:iron complex outermembrane receptor protein